MRLEHVNEHFWKVHLPSGDVIHHMTGPEPGDYHDHPWQLWRRVLAGWCVESVLDLATGRTRFQRYDARDTDTFSPRHVHKIVEVAPEGYLSLCRYGPTVRTSRFYRHIDGRWQTRTWWPGSEFGDDFTEHP